MGLLNCNSIIKNMADFQSVDPSRGVAINYLIWPLILTLVLLTVGLLIKFRSTKAPERITPFECGFDPSHQLRSPFSMRFFLVRLAFLVFDIEIALILPLPMVVFHNSYLSMVWFSLIFVLLFLGAVFEWNLGSLEWKWAFSKIITLSLHLKIVVRQSPKLKISSVSTWAV